MSASMILGTEDGYLVQVDWHKNLNIICLKKGIWTEIQRFGYSLFPFRMSASIILWTHEGYPAQVDWNKNCISSFWKKRTLNINPKVSLFHKKFHIAKAPSQRYHHLPRLEGASRRTWRRLQNTFPWPRLSEPASVQKQTISMWPFWAAM